MFGTMNIWSSYILNIKYVYVSTFFRWGKPIVFFEYSLDLDHFGNKIPRLKSLSYTVKIYTPLSVVWHVYSRFPWRIPVAHVTSMRDWFNKFSNWFIRCNRKEKLMKPGRGIEANGPPMSKAWEDATQTYPPSRIGTAHWDRPWRSPVRNS